MSHERTIRALWFAGALGVVGAWAPGCGGGEGVTPAACEDTRCNADCVSRGETSGRCQTDTCVCVPPLDVPPGPTSGVTSGGQVHRESAGFQLDVTVGGVSPSAEGRAGTVGVEVGVLPQTDPTRGR